MLLLTGATGYIGAALLPRLRARGGPIRCLVLPAEPASALLADGDVTDPTSLGTAVAGASTIVHCAALMLPNDGARIRRVNVDGTRNLIACAREHGARRFVYFSAVSAVYRHKNVYGESKAAAEALVADSGLEYTVLRPTMVYGRGGGLHFQQLVRLVRRAPGVLPVLGSGRARLQPVWIDDVVRAVELVLDHSRSIGRTYGVSGATVVTFDEFVDRISAALGRRPPPKLHVPLSICLAAAHAIAPFVGSSFFSPAALRGIPDLATVVRTNVEFFVGRFAGVLVYFPGLLACAVWARWWDREKLAWLLALLATCEALMLAMPHNTMGGQHALGNRLFVLLPVALSFVDQLNWQPWRVLATAGLLAVAVPVVQAPVHLSLNPGQQMLDVPYRFLPLEWSQAGRLKFPYMYPHGLAALGDAQYAWEGNGLWTRGAAAAEFVLITRAPAPRVRLWSLEPEIRVRDGGVPVALDWHAGAEVELTLAHPLARYREHGPADDPTTVYTLTVSTRTGTYGYTLGNREDSRYLGVFVRPLPSQEEQERH